MRTPICSAPATRTPTRGLPEQEHPPELPAATCCGCLIANPVSRQPVSALFEPLPPTAGPQFALEPSAPQQLHCPRHHVRAPLRSSSAFAMLELSRLA